MTRWFVRQTFLCAAAVVWATTAMAQGTQTYGPTRADYQASLDRLYAAGEHFRTAGGSPRAMEEARKWYEIAAAAGDPRAMAMLGWQHRTGNGAPQDLAAARYWYSHAVARGHREPWVQYGLGWLMLHGQGGAKDELAGHALIVEAAQKGYALAQFHAGWNCEEGRGTPVNYEQARRWYEVAAAAGNSEAMARLAHLYHKGRGVRQDFSEAARWYKRAAYLGQPDAMFNLGVMAEQGDGEQRDILVATRWFAQAAIRGHAEAMVAVGLLKRSFGERVAATADAIRRSFVIARAGEATRRG